MRDDLQALETLYRHEPSEFNRYQLVRHEQRIAQWVPSALFGA